MNTLKVSGVLICLLALASAVSLFVTKKPGQPLPAETAVFGSAFFLLVMGIALIQGVNAVRVFVLLSMVVTGLGAMVLAAVLHSVREFQMLGAAALLGVVGFFALLINKEASIVRVVVSVALILGGIAGGMFAGIWLVGFEKRAFGDELRKLAGDEREFSDPASGMSLTAPAGWVILRKDAEVFGRIPAKVKLADPGAGIVAFLNDEDKPPNLLSLDHFLDGVLEAQKEGNTEVQQNDRTDVTVGKAQARKMTYSWKHANRPYSGFVSVWVDGPRVYTLMGAAVGAWRDATEARFHALEAAMRFSAPVETAFGEAIRRVTSACPLLNASAVRTIGRRIRADAPAEAFFMTAMSLAIKGQTTIDSAVATELRTLMTSLYANMTEAERNRFGSYTEKLRRSEPTTAKEDAVQMAVMNRAFLALPQESRERLQNLTDHALTIGSLL